MINSSGPKLCRLCRILPSFFRQVKSGLSQLGGLEHILEKQETIIRWGNKCHIMSLAPWLQARPHLNHWRMLGCGNKSTFFSVTCLIATGAGGGTWELILGSESKHWEWRQSVIFYVTVKVKIEIKSKKKVFQFYGPIAEDIWWQTSFSWINASGQVWCPKKLRNIDI